MGRRLIQILVLGATLTFGARAHAVSNDDLLIYTQATIAIMNTADAVFHCDADEPKEKETCIQITADCEQAYEMIGAAKDDSDVEIFLRHQI